MNTPLLPFPRPPRLRLAGAAWQVLLHLALPALVVAMLLRSRREPLYRARLRDRFGLGPRAPQGCVWVFAASLGETRAASPLVRALIAEGHHVLMTHSSPAGLTESARLFPGAIADGRMTQGYMAADLFWAVRLFLWRNRPALGLVVEAEIWPAMLLEARRAGLPVVHVNGNLVEHSVERDAGRLGGVRLMLFQGFQKILTKSEAHVARYRRAGVPEERIRLVGELKFEQWIDPAHLSRADAIRESWTDGRPTLMIASSVEDEEDALFDVLEGLSALPRPPRVLWVPRSPQRFDAVAQRARAQGHDVIRRSAALGPDLSGDLPGDADVIVGDSIGEMNFYYRLADLVFVGATLADHGGHNIIEPLALGRPVLVGPSLYGITFPAREAIAEGACESLPDGGALLERAEELLADDLAFQAFRALAQGFCANHMGATRRTLEELRPYLPAPELKLRRAIPDDVEMLGKWRNDPVTRAMSLNSAPIGPEEHKSWYRSALKDPDREVFIAEEGRLPVGMVRFDRGDGVATVSILLAPDARGRGLSRRILELARRQSSFAGIPLRALIRPQNAASIALFTGMGFRRRKTGDPSEFILEES